MAPKTLVVSPAEQSLQEAQNLLQLWLQVKQFLGKAMTEEPITREDEQAFLHTKSEVSRCQRGLSQKMPGDVQTGGDKMQDLLRQAISIGHLRALPKADKQILASNWHASFITLCRASGALQFMAEGYVPKASAGKTGQRTGMSAIRGGATKVKKKSLIKRLMPWITLAVLAAGIYYFMSQ